MDSSPTNDSISNQAALETCLDKVLRSPVFAKSPRQQDLLKYLTRETQAGNAGRLKGYSIGVEVFGRGTDFDPALDAIVRVEVGRLRSKLREYYDQYGRSDEILIELPKGGYALRISTQATPQHAEASSVLSLKPKSRVVDLKPSLAVLPFANLSADQGQDYFVDGITDSLIFELSKISGLILISRQSSFTYRNSSKSSAIIGQELGVKYLIDGSVQRSGQRVRAIVSLVDAETGVYLWSDRYENNLEELFSLQDQLTLNIIRTLQIKLAQAEGELFGHEGTENVMAHDALLRGLECHWKYTPKFIREARQHFERAVALDPEYASAQAWLARTLLFLWVMKWEKDDSLCTRAMQHAQTAVDLNSKLPYALSVLGWAHLWSRHRDESISACRQAVALDPNNYEALVFLSMSLSSAGFGEEALFYIEKGRRLNPYSSPFYEFALGQAYFVLEDYDHAIDAFKRGCELSETFPPNHVYLCTTYALLGMEKEMVHARETFLSIMGGDKSRMIEPPWTDDKLRATYEHLLKVAGLR